MEISMSRSRPGRWSGNHWVDIPYVLGRLSGLSKEKGDFRMQTFRCSGPGGQNINKRDTGVRITHLKTGISAQSCDERFQFANKRIAFRRLIELLADHWRQEFYEQQKDHRVEETIRTYHSKRGTVKDHRSQQTFNLKKVLNGDLDPVIKSVLLEDVKKETSE